MDEENFKTFRKCRRKFKLDFSMKLQKNKIFLTHQLAPSVFLKQILKLFKNSSICFKLFLFVKFLLTT